MREGSCGPPGNLCSFSDATESLIILRGRSSVRGAAPAKVAARSPALSGVCRFRGCDGRLVLTAVRPGRAELARGPALSCEWGAAADTGEAKRSRSPVGTSQIEVVLADSLLWIDGDALGRPGAVGVVNLGASPVWVLFSLIFVEVLFGGRGWELGIATGGGGGGVGNFVL
jgi:hypothetical protein